LSQIFVGVIKNIYNTVIRFGGELSTTFD